MKKKYPLSSAIHVYLIFILFFPDIKLKNIIIDKICKLKKASIVTDHIDHFTDKGLKLKSDTEIRSLGPI